jgi:hypothetical protein
VLVVVVGGPLLVIGASPGLRSRAQVRWLVIRSCSSDPDIRRTARGRLLEIGRPAIDDALPELVAAEVEEAVAAAGSGSFVGIVKLYARVDGEEQFMVLSILSGKGTPERGTRRFEERPPRPGNASALDHLADGYGIGVMGPEGTYIADLVLLCPCPDDLAPRILDAVKRRLP